MRKKNKRQEYLVTSKLYHGLTPKSLEQCFSNFLFVGTAKKKQKKIYGTQEKTTAIVK